MDAQPIKPALIQISYNSITRQTLCQQPFSFLDVTNLINRLFPKLAAKEQKQQQQPEDQEIITDENFVEVSENNGDSFNIFVLETDENSKLTGRKIEIIDDNDLNTAVYVIKCTADPEDPILRILLEVELEEKLEENQVQNEVSCSDKMSVSAIENNNNNPNSSSHSNSNIKEIQDQITVLQQQIDNLKTQTVSLFENINFQTIIDQNQTNQNTIYQNLSSQISEFQVSVDEKIANIQISNQPNQFASSSSNEFPSAIDIDYSKIEDKISQANNLLDQNLSDKFTNLFNNFQNEISQKLEKISENFERPAVSAPAFSSQPVEEIAIDKPLDDFAQLKIDNNIEQPENQQTLDHRKRLFGGRFF